MSAARAGDTALVESPSKPKRAAITLLVMLGLNALLSMVNWWPTPMVQLDARLAPEFVWVWAALLVFVRFFGAPAGKSLAVFTLAYMTLVIGRYFDVTAPALFGRDVNLYWDAMQIPRVVWVSLRTYPFWVTVIAVAAAAALFGSIFAALRWALRVLARDAAPFALARPWAQGVTIAALVVVSLHWGGEEWTRPYLSKPVSSTYFRQIELLSKAIKESQSQTVLPPSPAFKSDLSVLGGADVNIILFESYGMVSFANTQTYAQLTPSREALGKQIAASGLEVVSAYVGSTTFGGASELAQLALVSGINTADPFVHDLLLTTKRPTLVSFFKERGFETFGVYPALSWDWPEKSFYGFETFIDSRDMGYKGPKLGFWTVPDQYSLAWLDRTHPITPASRKRMTFFASITSHMPFHPVPPYLADWQQILSEKPFSDAQMAQVLSQKENWLNMLPAYTGMIDYNYQWLAGYLAQPKARESFYIVMGDHQPAANVTGPGATWDVPVHIISANPQVLRYFKDAGFKQGLDPSLPNVGKIFDLTQMLLDSFDSTANAPARGLGK